MLNSLCQSVLWTMLGALTACGQVAQPAIRRLPVSSFPELPPPVATQLLERSCLIPQTYQAHRPENVVHASLERPGSSDWAVLCSAAGQVHLLVFLASRPGEPFELAHYAEAERMVINPAGGQPGFGWGIDPATPARIRDAQAGLLHRPPPSDHDALVDALVDRPRRFHYFSAGFWRTLDTSE